MSFKKFWDCLMGRCPPAPPPVNSGPDGSMLIVVINKSTLVSNYEVKLMTLGVAKQARDHAAPAWDVRPPKVEYRDSEAAAEPGSLKVLLFDDADVAGALGYHSDGPDGLPYGRVFVKITQKYNASVSGVLSHEVLELMMDPQANYWADNYNEKLSYALEVADPVENDYYNVDVDGKPVEVSNFVLPSWFDSNPPAGAKFDWLGKLSKPFTMTNKGYVIIRDQGADRTVFGSKYPDWKKELKLGSASRTKRRQDQKNKV